jgi:hypothetical protein
VDHEAKLHWSSEIKSENRRLGIVKHTLIDESGSRMFPDFVRLEIVSYGPESGFYLLHLCADGTGTDTWHQTIEEAFEQAAFEFQVSREDWHDGE